MLPHLQDYGFWVEIPVRNEQLQWISQ